MQTITVGKKKTVTFIPKDQNGNSNPVGSDGLPLQTKAPRTWFLEPVSKRSRTAVKTITGFTLEPSSDCLSCGVIANTVGATAILVCTANRGDGVMVEGSEHIEATPDENANTPVIASLELQFGPETDAGTPDEPVYLGLRINQAS